MAEAQPKNAQGYPVYPVGTPVNEVNHIDRGQKMVYRCHRHPESEWASKEPWSSTWFPTDPRTTRLCPCSITEYRLSRPYSPTRND